MGFLLWLFLQISDNPLAILIVWHLALNNLGWHWVIQWMKGKKIYASQDGRWVDWDCDIGTRWLQPRHFDLGVVQRMAIRMSAVWMKYLATQATQLTTFE